VITIDRNTQLQPGFQTSQPGALRILYTREDFVGLILTADDFLAAVGTAWLGGIIDAALRGIVPIRATAD
jgi:hypothetical protein